MSTAAGPQPGRLLPEPVTRAGQPTGFDMPAMASYYSFPGRFDGTGTTIALLSLYGGFRRSDLDTYFSAAGLAAPEIDVIKVGGARNNPVADPDANLELVMSLELLGAIAPGARLAVYLAENNELGVVDGLGAAISGRSDVLCLTWTAAESGANGMLAGAIGRSMQEAFVLGLPVCAPAGFWAGGTLQPAYPGSHPLVLACGATRAVRGQAGLTEQPMTAAPGPPSRSALWPMERWQAKGTGRTGRQRGGMRLVPDVAALADPQIGYRCYVNGRWASVSVPGAATCLWAGLLARLRHGLGRRWSVVSDLYSALGPSGALAAVPPAAAGSRPAWDSRTGWGTPDGERVLARLASAGRR